METFYNQCFEAMPCYLSVQNEQLRIIKANEKFKKDFGNFEEKYCYEIYKHRSKECVPCPVRETFKDGKIHQSEEIVTSINGKQINVLVNTAPIFNDSGQIQSVMEMSTNITGIRELQSQLSSIGLLISSISHGIRGELSGIDGGKYLINTGLKKNSLDRIEQGWEMIERNIERIQGMVFDILYYAKDREPKLEKIPSVEFAEEICDVVETKAKRQNTELQKDLDLNTGIFDGDRKAVRSLLINLFENSLDACRVDKKKDYHWIKFSLNGAPDYIEFEIEDNGIGMEREAKEKAFSLFFSSKGAEGTGLGLFIANKIAKQHGGAIQLSSEVDKGTSFTVKLPRKRKKEYK